MAHPLEPVDLPIIKRLHATAEPADRDIIDCARLVNRYRDNPTGAYLYRGLEATLRRWSLSIEQVQAKAKAIWQSGWRPTSLDEESEIGSGADVNAA